MLKTVSDPFSQVELVKDECYDRGSRSLFMRFNTWKSSIPIPSIKILLLTRLNLTKHGTRIMTKVWMAKKKLKTG